jgi:hypothetical protein
VSRNTSSPFEVVYVGSRFGNQKVGLGQPLQGLLQTQLAFSTWLLENAARLGNVACEVWE